MSADKLSVREKLGFGVCDLGGNLFFTALGYWGLIYLTDTVGLPAALAGAALMAGKVWDAVMDPLVGYASDRTRSRWGRRRPYLLFGALPLFLAMWAFFTAPPAMETWKLALWVSALFILLNTAYSTVSIPYSSLTPELTEDYHERSSLNGYRFAFAAVGTSLGVAGVPPLLAAFGGGARGYSAAGFAMGALMAATALLTFLSVRERTRAGAAPTAGIFATYASVFRTRPYVIILFAYALNIAGITFLQGVLAYYMKYVCRDEAIVMPAMILLLATAILCIPLSVLVSKRIGKKRTYQISFVLLIIASACIFFLGHILGRSFFLAVMVVAGAGIGFGYVAPWAMVPDAVEYDAARSGTRKEGAFYGMWTFVTKIGQTLCIGAQGLVLSLGGYLPNVDQTPGALWAIRLLAGPFPIAMLVGAFALMQLYPLDEKAYAALKAGGDAETERR